MTIKAVRIDPTIGYGNTNDTFGGQEIHIMATPELTKLIQWWKNWGPVFDDNSATVQDALVQARVLHELAKEQSTQPNTYSWTETTL